MPEVPAPPTECWLHPAVTVRASRIDGRGLIATADLPEGIDLQERYGGHWVPALLELIRLAGGSPRT